MQYIEDEHQQMIVDWANLQRVCSLKHAVKTGSRVGDYLVASANGGSRKGGAKEGARLKASGVKAGFPDLQLCIAAGGHNGLFIEMKKPIVKGQPKPAVSSLQLQWIDRLNHAGYCALVCNGFDEAKHAITEYLKGNRLK